MTQTTQQNPAKPTPAGNIDVFYQRIHQLVQYCLKQPKPDKAFVAAQQLSDQLYTSFCEEPAALIAQCHLYVPQYGYLSNQLFNRAVFSLTICQQLHWHPLCVRSVVSAALLYQFPAWGICKKHAAGDPLDAEQKKFLQTSNKRAAALLRQLGCKDPLCIDALQQHNSNSKVNQKPRQITKLANEFSQLITPNHIAQPVHATFAIKQLALQFPQDSHQALLSLASIRFAPLHFGSIIKVIHGSNEKQGPEVKYALLLAPVNEEEPEDKEEHLPDIQASVQQTPTWLSEYYPPANAWLAFIFNEYQTSGEGSYQVIHASAILKQLKPRICRDEGVYNQLWQNAFEAARANYPKIDTHLAKPSLKEVFHPKPVLKQLLIELHQETPDVSKLSELVEGSDYLKQLLNKFASQQSKKGLEITDAKHALMMIGLERLGPLVVQSCVDEKLEEFQFPGRENLSELRDYFLEVVREIAQHNDLAHPEETTMIAHCFVNPTWLQTNILLRAFQTERWFSLKDANQYLESSYLQLFQQQFNCQIDEKYQQRIQHYLQHWFFPKYAQASIQLVISNQTTRDTTRKMQRVAACIKLAIHCSYCQLHGLSLATMNKHSEIATLLKQLGITSTQLPTLYKNTQSRHRLLIKLD